jgi:[ribosomal protein S5]-alanine N-acetyltransferase
LSPGWPAQLRESAVVLQPLRMRDGPAWLEVRLRNERWLAPWEATPPALAWTAQGWAARHTMSAYASMLRSLRRQARAGTTLPFAIWSENRLVGQLTVGNVVRGALNGAYIGYWVDEAVAGRGIMPTAIALVADHCFRDVGLHRLEANIRPENAASRRVVEKLGFVEEGLHRGYLMIDGAYRDHICYALLAQDVPGGLTRRWRDTPRRTP